MREAAHALGLAVPRHRGQRHEGADLDVIGAEPVASGDLKGLRRVTDSVAVTVEADEAAASLADVQSFFKTYYAPNNAVLLILGDVKPEEGLALAKKYFGDIPAGAPPPFADPREPEQTEERRGGERVREPHA